MVHNEHEVAGYTVEKRFFLVCCVDAAEYWADHKATPITLAEARVATNGSLKCSSCGNVHAAALEG